MLKQIQTLLAIITTLLVGLWFIYDTRAMAESNEEHIAEQEEVKKYHETRIKGIEDLLLKQQAATEAEKALLEKLCRSGKLKPEDCAPDGGAQ